LIHIEERFAVSGEPIDATTFERAAGRVREAATRLAAPPTFFEATTALAFDVFREAGVEIAVLEVGLGGRLDATNAVDATAAVVTAIDLDHQETGPHDRLIAEEGAASSRRSGDPRGQPTRGSWSGLRSRRRRRSRTRRRPSADM
jgi:dihydrofolate synthase/folylpolyglutamate synthase